MKDAGVSVDRVGELAQEIDSLTKEVAELKLKGQEAHEAYKKALALHKQELDELTRSQKQTADELRGQVEALVEDYNASRRKLAEITSQFQQVVAPLAKPDTEDLPEKLH